MFFGLIIYENWYLIHNVETNSYLWPRSLDSAIEVQGWLNGACNNL